MQTINHTIYDFIADWMDNDEKAEMQHEEAAELESPEVVQREEKTPAFIDLKDRIAEYEDLIIHNAALGADDFENGPRRKNVLARQKDIIKEIKEDLKRDVKLILQSAKNLAEEEELLQFLRDTISDPFLKDQLLNQHPVVMAEKYLKKKKEGIVTPLSGESYNTWKEEEKDSTAVPSNIVIPEAGIRLDTPDVGDSFLVSQNPDSKMLEQNDEEIERGLEREDPLLGDSESASKDRADMVKIQQTRNEAKARMTKQKKAELAAYGIRVAEKKQLDDLPVQIGYETSTQAAKPEEKSADAKAITEGEQRIKEIQTGFKDIPEPMPASAVKDQGEPTPAPLPALEAPIVKAEEEKLSETVQPHDRKKQFEETLQKIDSEQAEIVKEAPKPLLDEEPKTSGVKEQKRGVFATIWNGIARNKQVGSDVLNQLNKRVVEERAKHKEEAKL